MRAADLAVMSVGNLGRRTGRTILTLVGVVIGVAALVMLVSLGIGLKVEILKIFQDEDELSTIRVTRLKPGAGREPRFTPFDIGGSVPITEKQIEELRSLPGVGHVVPDFNLMAEIDVAGVRLPVIVNGAYAPDEAKLKASLKAGTFWTSPTERSCVLPSRILEVRTGLKPEDVLGKQVVFSRGEDEDPEEPRTFTVVGVLDSERLGLKGRMVYVPWDRGVVLRDTLQGGAFPFGYRKGTWTSVAVRAADVRAVNDLQKQLKNLNYEAITTADYMGMIDKGFYVVQGFMAAIGAIGVIVALFGIANTMTMSVLERTREIGIMKALGARNRDIRRIFLLEAASIGVIGGLAGLALGSLASMVLAWIARKFNVPESVTLFHVSWWLAGGSVAFAVVVSVVAGLVPALRASRLEPVKALRYE